jgi:hypothetical protein
MKQLWIKFLNWSGKISRNRYFNFALGILLFALFYSGLGPLFTYNLCIARGISIFFVFLISYVKEYKIMEKWFGQKVDPVDSFIMDLGGIVGIIITSILW